jgi:hypothetical protein
VAAGAVHCGVGWQGFMGGAGQGFALAGRSPGIPQIRRNLNPRPGLLPIQPGFSAV